jgi:hypothetical protein
MVFAHFIGLHMPGNKVLHPRFFFIILVAIFWYIMFINGLLNSLDDPFELIHSLFPASLTVVLFTRILLVIVYKSETTDLLLQVKTEAFYAKYQIDERFKDAMVLRIKEVERFTRLNIYSFCIVWHSPTLISLLIYVANGDRILIFRNFMPFTDLTTDAGFFLNLFIMTLLQTIGFVSLIIGDAMLVFYGYQVVPMCDVMCKKLEILAEALNEDKSVKIEVTEGKEAVIVEVDVEANFIEIIKEHQEYDEFIKTLVYLVDINCFTMLALNSISIGMSIAVCLKISMPMGIINGGL